MNSRVFLKNIVLLILLIVSIIFIFLTNSTLGLSGIGHRPLFIPITLSLNILLLEKRKKPKFLKVLFLLLCILNSSWILYHTYELITYYIQWNFLELDTPYLYLTILIITFLTSIPDLKKETHPLNDNLTTLVTILMIFIHYRYYLDKNFLHNIVKNVSSSQYHYVTQYYIPCIFIYIILFINKKINQIKK